METVDAVVIGAGPNGLVGANALADAGWDVLVLEAQDEIGGAVRSARLWPDVPEATSDLFSAFYPLAAASPVIRRLELERHGLAWVQAPTVLAHVSGGDEVAVLHRDPDATAAALNADHPGDGDSWLRLAEQWRRVRDPLLDALFTPFPPVRPGARLLRRAGARDTLELARIAAGPAARLGREWFGGEHGRLLVSGNALHADIPLDAPGSGLLGWLLVMLAQDVGFPVPQGGSGVLTRAMAARARAGGARIDVGENVTDVVVRGGRAVAVRTATGREVGVRRAVLADVDAPRLFDDLVGREHLPARMRADLDRFEWDLPTVKVNWLVEGGVPWRAEAARRAGTVHFGTDRAGLERWSADLAAGRAPQDVFGLLGQMTTADPTRSPAGTESVWAYTHLPPGGHDDAHAAEVVTAMERTIEGLAPGFRDRSAHRHVQLPSGLQAADGNLRHGAINGGTAQLHQQLVFRPVPGLGRAETVIDGLYLAGASAHPGGGVHGACGWIAARSALSVGRRLRKRALRALY